MVIVGWGSEGGQPYWLISNSHGIDSNDRGHIKWGIQSNSNPISRVFAVKVKLPDSCTSQRPCQNGGAFEDDCQCRCVAPYSGTTCTTCALTCQNGGTRVSGNCECACPVHAVHLFRLQLMSVLTIDSFCCNRILQILRVVLGWLLWS